MSVELVDRLIREAIENTSFRTGARAARVPQVSLLPTEVRDAARERRFRALLGSGVLAVVLLVAVAVVVAASAAGRADERAAAASRALSASAAQLARFDDVRSLQNRIALGQAAVDVGASTAIDWQRLVRLVEADLPGGFMISAVHADAATPFADYPQGATPIELPRAASMQVTVKSAAIDRLPDLLRRLKSLPAYADLSSAVSSNGSAYTTVITIHFTTAAYETPLKGAR